MVFGGKALGHRSRASKERVAAKRKAPRGGGGGVRVGFNLSRSNTKELEALRQQQQLKELKEQEERMEEERRQREEEAWENRKRGLEAKKDVLSTHYEALTNLDAIMPTFGLDIPFPLQAQLEELEKEKELFTLLDKYQNAEKNLNKHESYISHLKERLKQAENRRIKLSKKSDSYENEVKHIKSTYKISQTEAATIVNEDRANQQRWVIQDIAKIEKSIRAAQLIYNQEKKEMNEAKRIFEAKRISEPEKRRLIWQEEFNRLQEQKSFFETAVANYQRINGIDSKLLSTLKDFPLIRIIVDAIKNNFEKQIKLKFEESKESKLDHSQEKLDLAKKIEAQFNNLSILLKIIQNIVNEDKLKLLTANLNEDQLKQLMPLLEGNRIFTNAEETLAILMLKEIIPPSSQKMNIVAQIKTGFEPTRFEMRSNLKLALNMLIEKTRSDFKPNLFAASPDLKELEEGCNLLILSLLCLKDEDLTQEDKQRLARIETSLGGKQKFALLLETNFEKLIDSIPSLSKKFNNQDSALLTQLPSANEIYDKRFTPRG